MHLTSRRVGPALAALALTLTLSACGDDTSSGATDAGDESSAAAADTPTQDELRTALLTAADVPDGYTETTPEDDDSDVFGDTCLADVSDFEQQVGTDPSAKVETEFDLVSDTAQSSVSSSISAYPSEDDVTAAMQSFYASVDGCDTLSFTDDQGTAYDIDISLSDEVTIDGAQQQLSVGLTGTATNGDQSFPLSFEFYVAQEGAVVSAVGTAELGEASGLNDQALPLAQVQADRLADLLG